MKKGSATKDKLQAKILNITHVNPFEITQNEAPKSPGLKGKEGPVMSISTLKRLNDDLTEKVIENLLLFFI